MSTTRIRSALVLGTTLALIGAPLLASAAVYGGAHIETDTSAGIRVSASTTLGVHAGDRIVQAKTRADQEIARRIDSLTKLSARISEMKRLSASNSTTLSAGIQAQIDELTTLKATIDADDSTTTLRSEIQSITKSYRIFALVMPQAAITAAADRTLTLAALMEQFGAKLSTRITAAATSTASLQTTLDDYRAKVADAKTQAQAAIDAVAVLKSDAGDQAVFQANLVVLKGARAKVQAAQQDLVAARKDAGTIVQGAGGGKASVHASLEASTSAETH